MTKYIVKNCPGLMNDGIFNSVCYKKILDAPNSYCENHTGCPIKQIVEKCLPQSHIPEVDDLKEQILQTLQVEEVE